MFPREEDRKLLERSHNEDTLSLALLTALSIRLASVYGEPGGVMALRASKGRFLEVSRLMPLSYKHLRLTVD